MDINYPKLPECPFCNNAPRHLEVKVGYYTERVICDHCHFHLEGTTTQTAVERWNTRSSEESKYSWDSATQAAPAHPDDAAVDTLAAAMKATLTPEAINAMAREYPAEDLCGWSYRMGVADAERHHGITGGQHE